jgi:outer membrane protein
VGTRNIVDVLLAQQRLFLSEFQFASARYQYIKNTLRLKQLVGSLDQQDLVELNRFIDVSKSVTQVKPLDQ